MPLPPWAIVFAHQHGVSRHAFSLSLTVSAVATLALAAVATATPISVTYNGVSPSKSVSLSKNSGGTYSNYTAGLNNLTGAVSNQSDLRGAFTAFCIDINQTISNGNSYTDFNTTALQSAPIPTSPMGAAKADQISQLWYNGRSILSSSDSYAAFQVAIWEIVNDTGLSLSGGTFRAASGSVRTLAQGYLDKIDGIGGRISLFAIASPSTQDFVVPTALVPAPAAAGLGLLGLGMASRRNRRK